MQTPEAQLYEYSHFHPLLKKLYPLVEERDGALTEPLEIPGSGYRLHELGVFHAGENPSSYTFSGAFSKISDEEQGSNLFSGVAHIHHDQPPVVSVISEAHEEPTEA